ncbi:helix-turn-helix domain-containing protein [Nocardia sp. CA-119907]|uniref:helix-turn-helix domain-containing protein n=1 Tax=Nocardia sp. CA-119907 TaxID=3239973 RepID=UPI003D979302
MSDGTPNSTATPSGATADLNATPKEAAKFLRTTPEVLAQMRYLNRGPEYTRNGRRILYSWAALRAYLDANTVRPSNSQSGAA